MPIKPPGPRLGDHVPLNFAKKSGRHGRKSSFASLNLTSMVDMFTILVVFLLMTFSASGDILFVQQHIILPKAVNFSDLEIAPVVGISQDVLTLDGARIGTLNDLRNAGADLKIPEMAAILEQDKKNWEYLHHDQTFPGTLIIQSDREVKFDILKRIIITAGSAHYTDLNFAIEPGHK